MNTEEIEMGTGEIPIINFGQSEENDVLNLLQSKRTHAKKN